MDAAEQALVFLAPYQPGLLALSVLCLVVLIQNFATAIAFSGDDGQAPGLPVKGDHSLLSFRIIRTYGNSAESLPAFGFALVAAILGGASVMLVNWLAVTHLVFRLLFWAVYYSGIGKPAGGPRTMCYVGGLLSNIALALTAIYGWVIA